MKFGFLRHRLMNEAVDLGDTGGGVEAAASASLANEYSSRSIIGDDDNKAFRDLGLDPAKYGLDGDSEESLEENSQGSEEVEEAGQATDEKSFLDLINSMELIHNENPFKVESKDELKNLVQMGKDYTLKTQSLSEERKAWEAEKSGAEEEIHKAINELSAGQEKFSKQIQELEQWTFALNELRDSAPDVFEEVQRAFSNVQKQFSNPVLDKQLAAIRAELAETKKGLTERENKMVVDEFEREFASMSALEQSLKELGINVDKEAVKKEWANTGLPLKNVIGSLYFEQMAKAQASKSKVEATKAKVNAKPTAGAGVNRTGGKVKAIDPKLKGLAYASALLDRYTNI